MNLKKKIFIHFGAVSLGIILLLGLTLYVFLIRNAESDIHKSLEESVKMNVDMIYSSINQSIKTHLRTIAEKTRNMMNHYYQMTLKGQMTREAAYQTVRKMILSEVYGKIGKTGYLACVSSKGILAIHPKSEGMDASHLDFMKKAMEMKNGYLEYNWKNKDEERERLKVGYLSYFEPWDLMVWASSYKDEFYSLINIEDIKESIISQKIGKSGYIYVLDLQGKAIIHPYREGESFIDSKDSKGRLFIREILDQKNGKIVYNWKNPKESISREKLAYFKTIPELGWILIISSYTSEFFEEVRGVEKIFLLGLIIAIGLTVMNTFWSSKKLILKPLSMFQTIFIRGAKGDLNVEYPIKKLKCDEKTQCKDSSCGLFGTDLPLCFLKVGSYAPDFGREVKASCVNQIPQNDCKNCQVFKSVLKDEIDILGAWFNEFLNSIRSMIFDIKNGAYEMSDSAERLRQQIKTNIESSEYLAGANQLVIEKVTEQRNQVIIAHHNIQDMFNNIAKLNNMANKTKDQLTQTTRSIEEMNGVIGNSADRSIKADETSEKLLKVSEDGNNAIETLNDSIEGVAGKSEQIKQMIQLIMDIAEETNLLAMNAAIEAAHAGEYGKGFAVVSEEIRELADKSAKSAKEIQFVVKEINQDIQNNLSLSATTKESFQVLQDQIKSVRNINREIASSMTSQKESNKNVIDSINVVHQLTDDMLKEFSNQSQWGWQMERMANDLEAISKEVGEYMELEQNSFQSTHSSMALVREIADSVQNMAEKIRQEFSRYQSSKI